MVAAPGCHHTVVEERHIISRGQHEWAGGDDERRAAPAVFGQAPGDPGLGVRVDRAGRLDEDEDLGVREQRPGEGKPLTLAT